jgi:hypothetical protein
MSTEVVYLLLALVALVALDVTANRFGRDSRSMANPRRDWK